MIIVDTALRERQESGDPVRVAMVGAGYSGCKIAHQILNCVPGIRLVAIANRTISNAEKAFLDAGAEKVTTVKTSAELESAMSDNSYAVTDDPRVVCEADGIEVIIEATGTIEFGSSVVLHAIENRKHVVLMNVELDATVGPILKEYADRAGVVISNADGDEPGVAMNLSRFVKSIGLKPVVAGNLKGLYDKYRNPDTQIEFARMHNQKPATMASFADGTKLSMELTVLANGMGFRVGKRGMYGPKLKDVKETPTFYQDKLLAGGMVDFLEGAAPANGAFVLGYTEDSVQQEYLQYLKMGEGPLYAFYTPFHLPQMEISNTVARVALFGDAAVAPMSAPSCDAIAVAKRDLKVGEILDGLGGFTCYTLIDNYDTCRKENALPMGVSEGCRLTRDISKDAAISYDDVVLPANRTCDRLRVEQDRHFSMLNR